MDNNELFLAQYHKINTLKCLSSSESEGCSDEDSPDEFDYLPKLISRDRDKVAQYHVKIKEFFDNYTNEIFTRKDFKLLNKVYSEDMISESTLNKMQVAGDGAEFRHLAIRIRDKGENEENDEDEDDDEAESDDIPKESNDQNDDNDLDDEGEEDEENDDDSRDEDYNDTIHDDIIESAPSPKKNETKMLNKSNLKSR